MKSDMRVGPHERLMNSTSALKIAKKILRKTFRIKKIYNIFTPKLWNSFQNIYQKYNYKKVFFFRIFRNIWNIQKKLRIHYREHSNKDKQFLTNFFLSNKEYSNGDTFFQRPIFILGSLFLAIWKTKKVWQATKDTT